MGLDIRGYYGVKLVGIREATDEEYEEPLIVVTEYFGAFPDAVKGMNLPELSNNDMGTLVFSIQGQGPETEISYSGYHEFRRQLADHFAEDFSGYPLGKPFWELLHMSDCQGFFSPEVVKEVARDFSTYHGSFTSARPLWGSVYCRWMEVFGWAAANDGIVVQS